MNTVQHDDGRQESHVNVSARNENPKTGHVNKLEKTSHSSIDMYSSASQKSSPNQGNFIVLSYRKWAMSI